MTEPAERIEPLLAEDEPHPVHVERAEGSSPYFLTCDHAGYLLPRRLGDLGVAEGDRRRHIGWDIGAFAVARGLSQALDAPLVAQRYSRLVIDCNRRPGVASSIPHTSDRTPIPGNVDLHPAERRAREEEIHAPYHGEIARQLDGRAQRGHRTLLVAVHSMTPVFGGVARPWQIAFSTDHERSLVEPMIEHLAAEGLEVGDGVPYSVNDDDYTIPVHGAGRRMPRALVELRQDLIASEEGQSEWVERLGRVLRAVLAHFD